MRLGNSELLSVDKFNFNPSGISLVDKLPQLKGAPFIISLQKDSEYYFAEITFNYASNWLSLKIKDAQNNIIQGETNVSDFPYNLLLTPHLNDYGLFYFADQSEFRYYKLGKEWYNTLNINFLEYEELMKQRVVF